MAPVSDWMMKDFGDLSSRGKFQKPADVVNRVSWKINKRYISQSIWFTDTKGMRSYEIVVDEFLKLNAS